MRNLFLKISPWMGGFLTAVVFLTGSPGSSPGQELEIDPLINARSVASLVQLGDRIFGGLDEGGLVVWDSQDPGQHQRYFAGDEVSGNQVSDLAWTGRFLWMSTRDGGLTRIDDSSGELEFRQYSSNLGSLNLTAVTGTIIGGSERVYYGMENAGIGAITDNLPGNLYTAEQDGLISNSVNALQFFDGVLFVATPLGISRFADNLFTDQNEGLTDLAINDLTLDTSGDLLAAGNGGVFRWNPGTESWTSIGGPGSWVTRISSGPVGTFALGLSGSENVMGRLDGTTWTSIPLPYNRTYAVLASTDLWAGGRIQESGMASQVGNGWLGRQDSGGVFETWRLDASLVRNANGVTFGTDNRPWIGSHNADAISQRAPEGWDSIYEIASADNDSSGLFNQGANVLSMTTGTDGIVYAGQYSAGVVRWDPQSGSSELMFPANCGLDGAFIVNMITHPTGPVIFMHDWANTNKVEVLVNTVRWRDPTNWTIPPVGEGGLGNGPSVWDAVVESNDVIWFAVEGTGLVRWDINGDILGPDDPLTWLDQSDDRWDEPISSFSGASNDPTEAVALALAPDGTIWVGGNGVVRFSYDKYQRVATVEEHFGEKTSPFGEGLINGNVADLTVGQDEALWVATRSGLNRGITVDGDTEFTAHFDLGNYLSNPSYSSLYSPNAITALPGGSYRKIVSQADGPQILLSSDRGGVLLESGEAPVAPGEGSLSSAYLYPNPFKPNEGDGQLKLAGIDADALNGDAADVRVFNLEGQLVYKNEFVSEGVGFWDGKNISVERNPVTTGMYVVKITFKGQSVVKPLAILR